MPNAFVASVAVSALVGLAVPGYAQTTRTGQLERDKTEKAAELQPPARETGDLVIAKLEHVFMPSPPAVHLTFGDFRPGAGPALGAVYAAPVGERGLWTTTGALSIHRFKEAETSIDIPPMSTDRIRVRGTARWEDAPDLRFFGLGIHAPLSGEATYGLRSTDVGGELRVRAWRHVGYGADLTFTRVQSADGDGNVPVIGTTTSSDWWRTGVFAEVDTRRSPGYTTTGGLYRVALRRYDGRGAAPAFERTEIDLRQFVPVLHENWIVALQARADLTASGAGIEVPFFMLPSLGGRDSLPGFDNDRFTDRNALLLRGELRWTAAPVVDMAVFVDSGTVSSTVGGLNLRSLEHSWGLGARIHGDTYTALRLQIARSPQGWRYNLAQGVSF
jgi:hypothetical protein